MVRMGPDDRVDKPRRAAVLLESPTSLLEMMGGIMLMFRGGHMIWSKLAGFSLEAQGLLIPFGWPEFGWASTLGVLGLVQLILSGHRMPVSRGVVATLAALTHAMAFLAYRSAGLLYRGAAPMLVGLVVLEMFLAYRCWFNLLGPNGSERRRHG